MFESLSLDTTNKYSELDVFIIGAVSDSLSHPHSKLKQNPFNHGSYASTLQQGPAGLMAAASLLCYVISNIRIIDKRRTKPMILDSLKDCGWHRRDASPASPATAALPSHQPSPIHWVQRTNLDGCLRICNASEAVIGETNAPDPQP
ncbi:hypothetical protein O181_075126 [Austropuccinia psidii MF-1]|uniref:Uncharacterized protein n=1 Tax=Austropuccinia psidii MF-1 TaxID=1389203 RepID=A0A9Q3F7X3_9BASI|nr:hypothetical protein [Austropuccinia psidii MF-1]